MAHPFSSQPLQVLLAAAGQLSGDGQLRELMQERRRHQSSPDAGLWYLTPELMQQLGLSNRQEGLVIEEPSAAV